MTRRLLSACVGAALGVVLSVPAHGIAKPPDLPEDGTFTATEKIGSIPEVVSAPDLPEDGTFTATPVMSPPALLFQLRPTARRTLAGSLLFGIHPALGLLPTENILDAPCDHPQCAADENVLADIPVSVHYGIWSSAERQSHLGKEGDWLKWIISHWTARQQSPAPEQNEGYIHPVATGMDFAYQVVTDTPASEDETPAPVIEILPMPHEDSDITCPYLRQQMLDKHACQIADPEIGRDVLANLESLKEADNLLELAKELARDGFFAEAMVCCEQAAKLCPGSPCAQRAVDTMIELARGIVPSTTDTEESAEPEAARDRNFIEQYYKRPWDLDPNFDTFLFLKQQQNNWAWSMTQDVVSEPGVQPMVCGLMKACHLLMSQGMQHQAAELARQAYALDPQRVLADPLIYKMHLLAESPTSTPAGSSEESEPPTCPYCPRIGKPIREIVPEKKKKSKDGPATLLVPPLPPIDYEVVPVLDNVLTESMKPAAGAEEASEDAGTTSMMKVPEELLAAFGLPPLEFGTDAEGGLRLSAECSLGDNVYHLRYTHGCLAIWKTTDASKKMP